MINKHLSEELLICYSQKRYAAHRKPVHHTTVPSIQRIKKYFTKSWLC